MRVFRLIATALCALILFIVSLVLIPFAFLLGLFNRRLRDSFSFRFVQLCLNIALFLAGAKVTYKGLENIPSRDETVCYIGNHRGIFDIMVLYKVLPSPTGFIAKAELKKIPLLSWWMHMIHCLFMDRSDKRQSLKTILAGIENVKDGICMVIFPEGTRSLYDGQLLPFKEGSFKLAIKPEVKIIPFATNNTSALFEDVLPNPKGARVCMEFGPPIDTAALSRDQQAHLNVTVRDIIEKMTIKNGIEIGTLPLGFVPDPDLVASKKTF